MPSYKEPGFQERVTAAARARDSALAKLKAKPPVDEAVLAARAAVRQAREAAEAEKREAAKIAREEARAAKRAAAEEAAALSKKPVPTEAELKAARDARYAARKNRKS